MHQNRIGTAMTVRGTLATFNITTHFHCQMDNYCLYVMIGNHDKMLTKFQMKFRFCILVWLQGGQDFKKEAEQT